MTSNKKPSRIHFGSCNSQHLPQPLWPTILERDAQAFIWAGDAVYGDGHDGRKLVAATPAKIAADYDWMLDGSNQGYHTLITSSKRNITIFGTFDDHDFGINNGDRTYPHRRETAKLFVDFLERSNQGSRREFPLMRKRAATGDGVYGVIVLDFAREQQRQHASFLLTDEEAGIDPDGVTGTSQPLPLSDKSVAIYAIDVRSNKTPWNQNKDVKTDYQGDFLGEKQWQWLESALSRSTAAVNIVVSGLQVHTDRFINGQLAEEWSRFPMAQHRLYQALLQPNVQTPFIISGDVHMGEFLRRDCQRANRNDKTSSSSTRLLIEMTTSGMTHSWGTYFCSRPEQANPICRYTYLQRVLTLAMHWAHYNTAWKELVHNEETNMPEYTLKLNFGEVEFDWEERTVTSRLIGVEGAQLQSRTWKMSTLSGSSPPLGASVLQQQDFEKAAIDMMKFSGGATLRDDYFCLAYRGPQTEAYKYFGFVTSFSLIAVGFLLPILLPLTIVLRYLRSPKRKVKND